MAKGEAWWHPWSAAVSPAWPALLILFQPQSRDQWEAVRAFLARANGLALPLRISAGAEPALLWADDHGAAELLAAVTETALRCELALAADEDWVDVFMPRLPCVVVLEGAETTAAHTVSLDPVVEALVAAADCTQDEVEQALEQTLMIGAGRSTLPAVPFPEPFAELWSACQRVSLDTPTI